MNRLHNFIDHESPSDSSASPARHSCDAYPSLCVGWWKSKQLILAGGGYAGHIPRPPPDGAPPGANPPNMRSDAPSRPGGFAGRSFSRSSPSWELVDHTVQLKLPLTSLKRLCLLALLSCELYALLSGLQSHCSLQSVVEVSWCICCCGTFVGLLLILAVEGRGRGGRGGRQQAPQPDRDANVSIDQYVHPSMWEDPWKELMDKARSNRRFKAEGSSVAGTSDQRSFNQQDGSSLADLLDDAMQVHSTSMSLTCM